MFKKSISTVLIFSVALAILATFAPIIWYVFSSSYDMAETMQRQAITQAAESTQRSLADFISGADHVAKNLAGQLAVVEAFTLSPVRADDRFKGYMESYRDTYYAMVVLDTAGKVLAGYDDTGRNMAGVSYAGQNFVAAMAQGTASYVTPQAFPAASGSDVYVLGVGSCITDKAGKPLGGVVVFPKLTTFTTKFLNPWRFGARGYGFFLDNTGRVMAHAADKGMLLKDVSTLGFIKTALSKKNGVVDYEWKDGDKFMAFATEPRTGWIVCMSAYNVEMTALATSQRNILLVCGAFGLVLLVAAVGFISSRLIIRPVVRIENFTDSVAKGDLRAELSEQFRFELGHLADNIRAMVAELKTKLGFSQGVLAGITLPCAVFDEQNRLTFVNQHMLSAVGFGGKAADYLGKTSGDFYFSDPGRETTVVKALREGRMFTVETDYTTKAGEARTFSVTSTPFQDLDGKPLGALAIWYDLTLIRGQQKAMEEQNATIARAADAANQISERLAQAAHDLRDNVDEATSGTDTQRARVSEVATSMDEMSATVLEVAKNSGHVADLAEQAKSKAQMGASSVSQVISNINGLSVLASELSRDMGELGRHAQGIGQIMTVIADIADQTNLLALNAAIEAARAGEAGRGFAVVADEVRKLAEKTMHATTEVSQFIQAIQDSARKNVNTTENTVKQIEEGAQRANQSGQALQEIVGLIEQTADQVRAIATAAEQQSSASEEINHSVDEINAIASRTSETMAHSAQAVADLARVAQDLKQTIGEMCNAGISCQDASLALPGGR